MEREIIYLYPNFNGCTVQLWEWDDNFNPHFNVDIINFPCWEFIKVIKRGPCIIVNTDVKSDLIDAILCLIGGYAPSFITSDNIICIPVASFATEITHDLIDHHWKFMTV